MKRYFVFGLVGALLALNLVLGAWIYLGPARAMERRDSPDESLDLFAAVLQKVRAEYVDDQNLTYRALVYSALQGMVSRLDPHSEFLDADDYQQLQNDTEGQFGGLGLVVDDERQLCHRACADGRRAGFSRGHSGRRPHLSKSTAKAWTGHCRSMTL